jgi:hypothetical protein
MLKSLSQSLSLVAMTMGLMAGCAPNSDSDPNPPGAGGSGAGGGGAGGSGGRGGGGGTGPGTGGQAGGAGTGGTTAGTGGGGAGGTAGASGGAGAAGAGGSTGGSGGSQDASAPTDGSAPIGDGPSGPIDPENPGPTDLTKHRFSKAVKLDTTAAGANVPGDVAKYPVAVMLNATNFDFSQALPAGQDIRFATAEGTLLPYAIELWDATAKQAAVWVKFDVKGNNATQGFVMHWGNPTAQSASSSKSVFSMADGFIGVYHLNEDGNNTPDGYKDSSDNGAHLTGNAMEPGTAVAARVGLGTKLDNPGGQGKNQWIGGVGPKIDVPFNASAARPITATAWAFGKSFSGYYETIISKGDTSWTLQRDYQGRMETCTWSGSYHSCAITGAPPVGRWVHYMVVQSQTNITLYVDGRRAAGTGSFGRTGMHGFAISHNYQSNANAATGRREWDGMIDEVRVMTGAKDVNWALLDTQSQREGAKFVSFGETQMK